jgi:hypothetical protein
LWWRREGRRRHRIELGFGRFGWRNRRNGGRRSGGGERMGRRGRRGRRNIRRIRRSRSRVRGRRGGRGRGRRGGISRIRRGGSCIGYFE